jgi:hypothetical protein
MSTWRIEQPSSSVPQLRRDDDGRGLLLTEDLRQTGEPAAR